MGTPHINAKEGDFAKIVLMPGDSYRARWIAENFLKDAKLVTDVRGIFGYTGYTKNGKRISVMASGMGIPSIGIYSHELFTQYGVETIVRIGTCGAYQPNIHLRDIIIAQGACTDSNWMAQYGLNGGKYSAISTFKVLRDAVDIAEKQGLTYHVGNVFSSDVFYDVTPDAGEKWAKLGVLAVEMETYSLFSNAAYLGKQALAILTVSDAKGEGMTVEQRQEGLSDMVNLAIALAEKYAD